MRKLEWAVVPEDKIPKLARAKSKTRILRWLSLALMGVWLGAGLLIIGLSFISPTKCAIIIETKKNNWLILSVHKGILRSSDASAKNLTDDEVLSAAAQPLTEVEKELVLEMSDEPLYPSPLPIKEHVLEESLRLVSGTTYWWFYHSFGGRAAETLPYLTFRTEVRYQTWVLFFPFVMLILPPVFYFGVLAFLRPSQKKLRLLEGRCINCGYQLRGLKSNICPECGTRFAHAIEEKSDSEVG